MGIVSSRFNWVSTPSGYAQVTNWRAKQQAFNKQIESSLASSSIVFANASADYGTGMAEIAANRAAIRVQTELRAKIAKAQLDMRI